MDKLKIYNKVLRMIERRDVDGICTCIDIVTRNLRTEKYVVMLDDFKSRLPSIRKPSTWRFYFSRVYTPKRDYKWTRDDRGREQRIKFLKHIIKQLEKQSRRRD
jgi:hypothetical protein